MRCRDLNPVEAFTLTATLSHGRQDSNLQPAVLETAALPVAPLPHVKRTMRQVTTGLVPPQPLVVIVMGMELGTEGLSRSFGFF